MKCLTKNKMNYTQRRLEEFAYQLKRTKECQIVLDHNPVWCGDCFACSECGKIFITASVANKSITQAIAEERDRMREWATEKKSVLEKKEEEHHKKFLQDEIRYKHNPTANNLEIMRLHEGSTSAYSGGLTQGKIESLDDILSFIDKQFTR